MKKIFKNPIFTFILGILITIGTMVLADNLSAASVDYHDTTVEAALDNLYANSFVINPNRLRLITGTNQINVEVGKKYIIFISITSYSSQKYEPSIVSGCTINKTVGQIHDIYNELAAYANAYLVTATSDKITISGNLADANWNFIGYYEF